MLANDKIYESSKLGNAKFMLDLCSDQGSNLNSFSEKNKSQVYRIMKRLFNSN